MTPIPLPRSARLLYAPLRTEDAGFLVELLNDADFLRHIGDRGVRREADVERYLEAGPWASYATHGFGLLAVRTRAGETPVGIAGLLKRPALADVDLGYALLPAHRGRGYAREAGRALLELARDALQLTRVVAIVAPDNEHSIRTLESLGFAPDGRLRLAPDEPEVLQYAYAVAAQGAPGRPAG